MSGKLQPIAVVSDDVGVATNVNWQVGNPHLQLLRSEAVVFGGLEAAEHVVIDRSSPDAWISVRAAPHAHIHEAEDMSSAIALAQRLSPLGADAHQAPVVAVLNAVGGAGASLISWIVAWHYAHHMKSVLIDVDDRSPGLDLWACLEEAPAVRWPELAAVAGDIDPRRLWEGLVAVVPGLRLLSHGRTPTPLAPESLRNVVRSLADYALVLDMSSARFDDVGLEVLSHASAVIVATRASIQGCAAAHSLINSLRPIVGAQTTLVCALRMSQPRVTFAVAQSVISVPVIALPEDTHTASLIHERKLVLPPARAWRPLLEVLPELQTSEGRASTSQTRAPMRVRDVLHRLQHRW